MAFRPGNDAWAEPVDELASKYKDFGDTGSDAGADATGWPEPRPLPTEQCSVPSLPADMVPEPFRGWCVDTAERICLPIEYIVAPALVAFGSVIGRGISIRPKRHDDWLVVPNLWGLIVGRPGTQKSAAVAEAMRPLGRLTAQAAAEHEARAAGDAAEADLIAAELAAEKRAFAAPKAGKQMDRDVARARIADLLRRAAELEAQHERRYVTQDATVEKLGELLNQNPRGLLLSRDELSGWLRSFDKPGREGDREFYLEAWNGTGHEYTVDRIGRGTLHVKAMCVSVLGGIQPGKLRGYQDDALADGAGADGLLQRFQVVVWPGDPGAWVNVDRVPDRGAYDRAVAAFEFAAHNDLARTLGATGLDGHVPWLRFADDAQQLFDAWRAALEARLRSAALAPTPAFEAHLAKFRSLLPSLALLFHVAAVAVERIPPGPVGLDATRLAAEWCEFLEAHARKVYSGELHPEVAPAHALAKKIKCGAVIDGDSVRGISEHDWTGLKTGDAVRAAVAVLAPLGWVRVERLQTRGRPSDVLRVNPKLRRTNP